MKGKIDHLCNEVTQPVFGDRERIIFADHLKLIEVAYGSIALNLPHRLTTRVFAREIRSDLSKRPDTLTF